MSSLLEKLKAGKRNVKVVKFPGTEEDIAIQVLSNQDLQDSVFAAEGLFKKAGVEITGSTFDAYEDERTTQTLFRALRDPENPKLPFAANVGELRRSITRGEKDALARLYNEYTDECSPDFMAMTDEEFDETWEVLKKNPDQLSNVSNLGTLRGLLRYLVFLPSNSPTANGST